MPLPSLRRRPSSTNGTASLSRQGSKPEGWDYDGKTPPEVLCGRSEFHRAFSGLARGKRNWQLAAFFAFAMLALAVAGLVTLAAQSRVVPYVVEVDRLGRASAIAPAEAVPAVADRVVIAALSAFVSNIRTVYADPVAQRDAVYRAYAYVGGDARGFLEAYFSDPQNDPRRLGTGARRSVEVVAVIPVPGAASGARTYRVTWNETESSPQRGDTERAWEGYLSVVVAPPTTTEGIERNPLGVFVTDLSWSPLAGATEVEEPETPEAEPDEAPALRGVLARPTPEAQPTARPDTLRP
ncbi:type IV secretion system protein [Rubrivirga litoralis]|uniref:Type IV secretion system protein n=1 Tax=Rubrivirga litoralis TaxID=3075598 RepID=A0ABU3BQ34_9BACT|nr:type IV secretion system protein [Rubrivirga sp. F394]MDT0631399.1 type IV secretion system protein [Rubrivirga sp. F394]